MTTTIKNSDGFDAATYYGKPLASHAFTSFGGATVRTYKTVDVSTDFRTILLHFFDISFWGVAPTVENAITWLHGKSYASDLLRNKMTEMPEARRTHEEAAKEYADDVVRCTEWEVLTNDEGNTIVRGCFREDLS
jgi:hypothetical protein